MAIRQQITPLDWRTRLVNADGTPTPQFIRLWQQLFGNDSVNNDDTTSLQSTKVDKGSIADSGLTMSASRLLGRVTSMSGPIEELTLSQALDLIGSAVQGDILYRGASNWEKLPAGISGQFLQTLGPGNDPQWSMASGSGGVFNGVYLTKSSLQSISASTNTAITFNQETYDTSSFHDNVTNNSRITIPLGSGITRVRLSANLDFGSATPSTGIIQAWIARNGNVFPGVAGESLTAFSGSELISIHTGAVEVTEGDFFQVIVFTTNASEIDPTTGTNFSMEVSTGPASSSIIDHPKAMSRISLGF